MVRKSTRPLHQRPRHWYRTLFQEAPVAHVVTREERGTPVVVECNELFARTLGYRPADVVGRSLLEFVVSETSPEASSNAVAVELRAEDGGVRHAWMRASPDIGEDGLLRGHRVAFFDATEARQREAALKEREAAQGVLLDAIPDKLVRVWRSKGRLCFEPARESILLDAEALTELETRHRSLPEEVARRFERPFEMALLGVTPTITYELEVDSELRHLEARLVKRGPSEALAIVRDVTGQKEIEGQLQESQRLEALGRLAGGISHDFNNLLTVITGNAEMVLAGEKAGPPLEEAVEEIAAAARRASELTRQLLAFSNRQVLEPKPVDLNALLTGMEAMLRRLIREDIRIQFEGAPNLGAIVADPGQIEQIIMNLAVNARDAMPGGGSLRFETDTCEISETSLGEENPIPRGHYVCLTVSDTGVGIPPQARAHIFEPFFTTKPKEKGTGLGLSTVYGIVKQSGGYIRLESEVEKGTTFRIYFPSHGKSEGAVRAESESAAPRKSGETVLLVEDDVFVLDLAQAILTRGGYRVISAPNGQRALKIATDFQDTIDLVATDVVMPGMSGQELASGLERLRPGLKILYMSGYAHDTIQRYGLPNAGIHFLEKPYRSADLLKAVRHAIDAGVAAGH